MFFCEKVSCGARKILIGISYPWTFQKNVLLVCIRNIRQYVGSIFPWQQFFFILADLVDELRLHFDCRICCNKSKRKVLAHQNVIQRSYSTAHCGVVTIDKRRKTLGYFVVLKRLITKIFLAGQTLSY